jgi:glycosyltransferase involved in cell wall biosynthesis
MNILINCSNLKIGGGLQVAHSFVSKLKDFKAHSFIVVTSTELAKEIDLNLEQENVKFLPYNIVPKVIKTISGKDDFLDKIVIDNKIEVVFSVFGPTYWKPKVKHIVGYAKPHYVYTDSPFFKTLSLMTSLKLSLKKFFHMYDFKHNNQIIITENEDVSIRLRTLLIDKEIQTVTNYYNQVFDQEEKWEKNLHLPAFDGFTMLTVSANYPHKNLQIIPKVIAYLNQNYQDFKFRFVVTLNKHELGFNQDENITKNIVYLGKTNINQCPSLYSQSDAIFLPTLLECFTATYPEAMRMQKPILTSNLNFATGLCENAALYFEPLDPKDIGDKIYKLANDELLKKELVANGEEQLKKYDTYATRAEKYIEIITK